MKRRVVILVLALCLVAGCGNRNKTVTDNEDSSMASADKVVQDENSNDVSIEEPTEDEGSAIGLDASKIIEDQSFDIGLNGWGDVRFVSCLPDTDKNPLSDATFYIMDDEKVIYKMPSVYENDIREWGIFEDISFVAFKDINEDQKDEVIVGELYVTGAGPQGMLPRTEVRVFEDKGDAFEYAKDLSEYINDTMPDDGTIYDVYEKADRFKQNDLDSSSDKTLTEDSTGGIGKAQEEGYDRTYLEEKDGVYTYRLADASIIEKYDELYTGAFSNFIDSYNEVMKWQNQSYRSKEKYTANSLVLRNNEENSVVKTGSYYEMDFDFNLDNVGYTYVDLDSDGTFELIFGILKYDEWTPDNIFERAYGLVNGRAIKICEGGSRDYHWLGSDGYIYETGSSGAAYSGTSRLRYDSSQLKVDEDTDWGSQGFIEEEFLGYWERPVHINGPYYDIDEAARRPESEISDDEWRTLMDEWDSRQVGIEWLKMSDYIAKYHLLDS
ncbi:hypothetical protein [Butyrivibrio sp. NC2002]|uniref:hypothetical protein n=1 Tax=Butyrivibrio sp. NC2002 TaxID=1410610 RepID=UPI00055E1D57|nr:hypothetical protein [Butyrivibrio sp. NC2002]